MRLAQDDRASMLQLCISSAARSRFNFAIRALRLFSRPMPQFTYRARDAQGGLVEGVLDCADRAVAIRQIESQHCIPIRIDVVDIPAKPKGHKDRFTADDSRKNCGCLLNPRLLRQRKT